MIRVLIVDDEPLARERVHHFLKQEPNITIIGESGNGIEAVAAIREKKPDLIFLDIQMPGMDGFEVLQHIESEHMPHIIFITAYDQYAIRAFEVHALDYLLKPFDQNRFKRALQLAGEYIQLQKNGDFKYRIKELIQEIGSEKKYPERFIIKSEGRIYFIRTDEVNWIESAANYVSLHVGREVHLMRGTMSAMEEKLDPDKFIRVNRAAIVNIEFIREIQPFFNGEYIINLKDDSQITLSRKYREKLKNFI